MKASFLLRAGFAAAFAIAASACGSEKEAAPIPTVSVAHPIQREVVEWDEYTARLQSPHSVEIRARISGALDSVNFRDGQMVEAGELLFVIDPRPYRAEYDRAKADVAEQESRLALARNEARRAERLVARKAISQEEFESRTSELRNSEAMQQSARAALESARLNLEFTEIRSPIRGRISRDLVHVGNLVNGGSAQSTLLTTVVSLDPIHAYFEADERSYLKYFDLAQSGQRPSSRDVPNPVLLQLVDETGYPHRGHMDFVDNVLDVTTGTIQARAVVPNPDLKLAPGLFARLRLIGSGRYQALLIPDTAIGTDQSERFVFLVNAEKKVERRAVRTGSLIEGFRVIQQGVTAQDWVVTSGLQSARAGEVVAVEEKVIEAPQRFETLTLLEGPAPPAPATAPAAPAAPTGAAEAR